MARPLAGLPIMRDRFLRALYEKTEGSPDNDTDALAIGVELGLSHTQTCGIVTFLETSTSSNRPLPTAPSP
jgi:plasmid stability protein